MSDSEERLTEILGPTLYRRYKLSQAMEEYDETDPTMAPSSVDKEDVRVSGYEMYVECPECEKSVRFNETGELVECPVFDGPASGCGAEFRVSATAEVVSEGGSDE